MSATFGRTSPRQFAYFDPDSSCWRTWPAISLWGPETFSETLPKQGSMRSGRLYERPTSGPATSAPDSSSLLPTPAASEAGGTPERHLERKNLLDGGQRTKVTELSLFVKTLLPTPTTQPTTGNGHARNLGSEVKTLPTPRTSDANGSGSHGEGGPDLRTAIKTLPTPTVGDSKDARNSTANRRRTPPTGVHAGDTLTDWATKLLPTPTARDHKGQNQRGDETCLPGAITALPSPGTPPPSGAPPHDPQTSEGDCLRCSSSGCRCSRRAG